MRYWLENYQIDNINFPKVYVIENEDFIMFNLAINSLNNDMIIFYDNTKYGIQNEFLNKQNNMCNFVCLFKNCYNLRKIYYSWQYNYVLLNNCPNFYSSENYFNVENHTCIFYVDDIKYTNSDINNKIIGDKIILLQNENKKIKEQLLLITNYITQLK
jgi:hypothetical protein